MRVSSNFVRIGPDKLSACLGEQRGQQLEWQARLECEELTGGTRRLRRKWQVQ